MNHRDSYLAVTGLPEPQSKHASIMARFAWDCLLRFGEVTKELESSLGPDTTSLSMRVGLHSGPVTAGVLKGDVSIIVDEFKVHIWQRINLLT